MSSSLSKTPGTSLISLASISNNAISLSSAQDVSTKFAATFGIRIGRTVVTALTNPVLAYIQGSMKSSGNDTWENIASFTSGVATSITSALAGSGNGAGVSALTATGSSSIVDASRVFILNGTPANSEFGRTAHVSGTTINLWDGVTNSQNSSNVFDQAEEFVATIDLTAWTRVRVVVFNNSGQTVYADAYMITGDSIG